MMFSSTVRRTGSVSPFSVEMSMDSMVLACVRTMTGILEMSEKPWTKAL